MATYYLESDGTLSKRKKKKKEEQKTGGTTYSLGKNGVLTPISTKDDDIAPVKSNGYFKESKGNVAETVVGSGTDLTKNILQGITGIPELLGKGLLSIAPAVENAQKVQMGMTLTAQDFENQRNQEKYVDKLITKDWYDEEKVAKTILSGMASVDHMQTAMQTKGMMTEDDLQKTLEIQKYAMNYLDNDMEKNSVFDEKVDSLAQSGGQLLGTMGLQAVGVPWWVTTGVTSLGGEVENALNSGATHDEAVLSGLISAGGEILSEKLSGGINFGSKTLFGELFDDKIARVLSQSISNKLGRNLIKLGFDATGEGFEEVFSELAGRLGKKLSYEDEKTWAEMFASEEAVASYIDSFIGGVSIGGVAGGFKALKSTADGVDFVTENTANEQKVVDAEVKNRIAAKEKELGKSLTLSEKTKIRKEVQTEMERGELSTDTIESILGGETYEAYKTSTDEIESLKSQQKALQEQLKSPKASVQSQAKEKLREVEENLRKLEENYANANLKGKLSSEVFELTKNEKLGESYREVARKSQVYEADLTQYDEKTKTTIQKAIDSGILNNTRKTHDFVDLIARLSAEKGVSFDFANNESLKNSGFAIEGKTINGLVHNGEVILNIDSAKALNTVVGHEITHILEGTELYSELQKSLKSLAEMKGEYQTRYDALAEIYKDVKDADIEKELTADLVGDYLFTDEDFIRNLSAEKPNLFKKIFEEIKYLCKKVTTGSAEEKKLLEVKRTFEKAFKESREAAEGTEEIADVQYSVSVSDKETLDFLNEQVERGEYDAETNPNGGYYVTYKSMSFWGYDENGNAILRSPMAEYVDGKLSDAYLIPKDKSKLNWYKATETIDEKTGLPSGLLVKTRFEGKKSDSYLPASENQHLIKDDWSNLYFNLKKKIYDKGKWKDSDVPARYNPYEHSSNSMLNDQFSSAYKRDNLVTVKMYVPVSEDNGTYRAKYSKDATGWADWKSGIVAGKIGKQKDLQRRVYLSRYASPVEIVPDSEVAQAYKEYVSGTDVAIPDNVVSPNLLNELKKAGVKIEESGKVKYSLNEVENVKDSNGETSVKVLNNNSIVKYSLSTWTPETQTNVRNNLVKAGFEEARVDKWIKDTNSIASVIASDRSRLDFEAHDNHTMVKSNSEYYKTVEASTLCAKRLPYQGTFDAIQHRLPNRVITSDMLIEMREMMREKGYDVPCGACYVESRRRHLGKFANEWLSNYEGEYIPKLAEVTTSNGLEKLRINHPQTYTDFIKAMDKKGSANPKVVQLRTEYKGEILDITEAEYRKIMKIGGLRLQSFSDFETPHLLDMMQVVNDMASRKFVSQAYTKVPNFAWVLGDTNVKINLSLIPKGNGLDADGNLIFDNAEGIDYDEAMRLRDRYSKNVGTTIIGINDEHILKCMADDSIDFIIPFHRSGWGANELKQMGLTSYKDYTTQQKERYIETGKGYPNIDEMSYWDFSMSGKENAETYLRICAEKGVIPKFDNFLVNNGDGSYSLQPDGSTDGYWKTLINFKMYDNDGIGSPHETVVPNFNMEEAYRVLDEYEGNANTLPVAEDVVEEFVAKYKDTPTYSFGNKTAPTGNYNVYGKDIALESALAPTETHENARKHTETHVAEEIAPTPTVTEASIDERSKELHAKLKKKKGVYAEQGTIEDWSYFVFKSASTDKMVVTWWNGEERFNASHEPTTSIEDALYSVTDFIAKRELGNSAETPQKSADQIRDTTKKVDHIVDSNKMIFADDYAPLTEEQSIVRDDKQIREHYFLDNIAPQTEEEGYNGTYAEHIKPEDPFYEKDIWEVGKDRKQKAYMYENPEVKPFFQQEARYMLGELDNSQKGEKFYNDQLYYDTNGEMGFFGTKRHTSEEIAYLLDTFNYTYKDIAKGLRAIIEDNGKENNAISKRIEFLIDERLRLGYKDFWFGDRVPPNQDYINLLNAKQITEYDDESWNNWLRSVAAERMAEDIAPTPKEYIAIESERKPKKQPRMARVKETDATEEPVAKIVDEEAPVTKNESGILDVAMEKLVDKGYVFEKLSKKTKNRELEAKYNFIRYADRMGQDFIGKGKGDVKALNDIQKEVETKGLTHELSEYLYHLLNIDRMTLDSRFDIDNKPVYGNSVTADISEVTVAEIEAKHPEFKKYAEDICKINTHLRSMLVDSGVISQETADLWQEMYPHYVPIRRINDKGLNVNVPLDTGETGVNAPVKRATGGSSDIRPLFGTMADRVLQTYKAVAKNNFGVELKNTLGTTINAESVDMDNVLDGIDQHEELLQEGKHGFNPTFTVFENGERVTFEITDLMYEALKPTSKHLAKTYKVPNAISSFHRNLVTQYNPSFLIRSAIKDAQDVLINSQHPTKTYANFPRAISEMVKNGEFYQEYLSNGGEYNTYFERDTKEFKKEKSGLGKVIGMPLEAIETANDYVEKLPRLAEYIASREMGRSIEVSMLDAARITTNFSAGADFTKWANRNGATFLNASVQGTMQQVRNIQEAKMNGLKGVVKLATKYAVAGLPIMLLNSLLWDDDEEYEELSDYVKQNYYVVAKFGDGQFVRIPKGRMVAVIQDAFEQTMNALTGNDEVDFDSFAQLVITNLAPNNPVEDNILAPFIQAVTNKTWYGDDLVPTRLQDVPKNEQFDETTDSLSKWLGENVGIFSPYQYNYLLDQYSGAIGDTFLPMLTPQAESDESTLLAPLRDAFTTDSTLKNQNVSDFYDTSDELTVNANRLGATDEDVLSNKYINSVKGEIGKLYGEKREIQNSNLSDSEKYYLVRDLQKKINRLSEKALGEYKNVNIDGNYATVGDRQYRLTDNGWEKLSDEQIEKQDEVTSSLGISPSEYWSNKEEYTFAYEKSGKYAISTAIGGYDAYKSHIDELNDIFADKDENGKTINGSAKEKKAAYINSLDLDYGQKIILYRSLYDSKADKEAYNMEIVEYLNSREDISYEEMKAILEELDFKVHDDGTITW